MSPNHRQPEEPDPNQGLLISAVQDDQDPNAIGKVILELHPEGVYSEEVEVPEGMVTAEELAIHAAREAVKTKNRRKGQEDKHSSLKRDGNYEHIRPGDVLPGFGPVKDRNWENAIAYARKLEFKRRKQAYEHPTIEDVTVDDVRRIIARDKNEPVNMARKPKTETSETLPRLTTMQDRLNAATEGAEVVARAPAAPMTKQETTTMLALNDHISRASAAGSSLRGTTHSYLMETHDHSLSLVKNLKHYSESVASWYADRAFASRVYEFVDYFEDAAHSAAWLDDFASKMGEALNPTQKKAVLEGDYHPAMGVLVGYLTVAKLESGRLTEEDVPFAPLTHQVNREVRMTELPTPKSKLGKMMSPEALKQRKEQIVQEVRTLSGAHTDQARFGRNKTYIMPFTNPDMQDDVKQFIQKTIASIPVGQLDNLIKIVQSSSEARQNYWRERLEDISGKYKQLVTPTLEKYPRSAKLQ